MIRVIIQWMRRLTLRLLILLPCSTTEPGHSQIIQATVWKPIQDIIWKMKRQAHQLIRLYLTTHLPILLLFFMTEPGPFQQIQATVWKIMQDLSLKMLIKLRHLLWLGIQILRIFFVSLNRTGEDTYIAQKWIDYFNCK